MPPANRSRATRQAGQSAAEGPRRPALASFESAQTSLFSEVGGVHPAPRSSTQ
jgi:hypothetical protein